MNKFGLILSQRAAWWIRSTTVHNATSHCRTILISNWNYISRASYINIDAFALFPFSKAVSCPCVTNLTQPWVYWTTHTQLLVCLCLQIGLFLCTMSFALQLRWINNKCGFTDSTRGPLTCLNKTIHLRHEDQPCTLFKYSFPKSKSFSHTLHRNCNVVTP